MRIRGGIWTLSVSLLCAASSAHAQTTLTLTIDDAVSRALEQAPRLAEGRARGAAAAAAVTARGAERRPRVTAISSVLQTNHVDEFGIPQPDGSTRVIFPDIPTNYRARAELTVPLYTSGRIDAEIASARAGAEAAELDVRAVRADIQLEVVASYWSLVTARARIDVLERARDRADAVVADVQARVDAGLAAPHERLLAESQRARQRVQLIQAENEAAQAEARLARLVGAQPGERLVPITPASEPAAGVDALLRQGDNELVTQALAARSERLALLLRQQAIRATSDAIAAGLRPQIGVLAAIEPARPNSRFVPRVDRWHTSWDLGVNVTWAIWDGGRSRADRLASQAQVDALGAHIAEFDAVVGVDVRERRLDLASSRAALEASNEAVTAAAEARRVVNERFLVGVATSTDVLDSDVALLEAELERTRLTSGVRIAEARLIRAMGGR